MKLGSPSPISKSGLQEHALEVASLEETKSCQEMLRKNSKERESEKKEVHLARCPPTRRFFVFKVKPPLV
jgi:hypothetical protein